MVLRILNTPRTHGEKLGIAKFLEPFGRWVTLRGKDYDYVLCDMLFAECYILLYNVIYYACRWKMLRKDRERDVYHGVSYNF